jgi:hypothetical protein
MTAVPCRNTTDRKAETWRKQRAPIPRLEFAVSDTAEGIAAAVEQVAEEGRRDESAAPLGRTQGGIPGSRITTNGIADSIGLRSCLGSPGGWGRTSNPGPPAPGSPLATAPPAPDRDKSGTVRAPYLGRINRNPGRLTTAASSRRSGSGMLPTGWPARIPTLNQAEVGRASQRSGMGITCRPVPR